MKKLLAWSDSIFAHTGFGRVSKELLTRLSATWDITQVAINHFDDTKTHPRIKIKPARMGTSPFGESIFFQEYQAGDYQACFILNDIDVSSAFMPSFIRAKHHRLTAGNPHLPIVNYFPIDGPMLGFTGFTSFADVNVTFTNWGREIVKKLNPTTDIGVIGHGIDTQTFRSKYTPAQRKSLREKVYRVHDDRLILISVNRNSKRKDLFQSMQACAQLNEKGQPTLLYLHAETEDDGFNLIQMSKALNLNFGAEILFPTKELLSCSDTDLNTLYSGADIVVSTARRGGWELSNYEGAAAGLPVVCPDYGPFTENMSDWGYLFPVTSQVWTPGDVRGPSYYSNPNDVVHKILEAKKDLDSGAFIQKQKKAKTWLAAHTWDNIWTQWQGIFNAYN